jgi:hypothetical protein
MTELKVRMQEKFAYFYGKEEIGEMVYLLFFAIAVGMRAIGWYDDSSVRIKVGLSVCAFLFLCKIILTRHTVKEYAIIGGFLLLAGIVYCCSGEKGMIVYFMMMLGMKKVDSKKVIECGVMVTGILIVFRIITGVFGLVATVDKYYPQTRNGVGTMFRHSLGYAHPNTLHMNVIMLTMMIMYLVTIYLKGKENSVLLLLMASVAGILFNLYIFQYSGSRTGVMACVVYVVVNFYLFIRKEIGMFEKIISYSAFPATAFIAIILPHILPENIFEILNRTIFHSRYMLARLYWSHNGISLFGKKLVNPGGTYATYGIDMAQLYLFLQLGIVTFVVVFAITTFFINRCFAYDKRAELSVMLAMLFIGIWEPLLYNMAAKNFAYVFVGSTMYTFLEGMGNGNRDRQEFFLNTEKLCVLRLIRHVLVGIAAGAVATVIFVMMTKEPTALYGAKEKDESNKSLGMTPEYYTSEEINDFKENGDIVLDYAGEENPMYKYGEDIAVGEYHKRISSVGVWTGIVVFSACYVVGMVRKKNDIH